MKKRVISVILLFTSVLSLSACGGDTYTDAERFAARAGVTISRQMGGAHSFSYDALEYSEPDGARIITARCTFFYTDGTPMQTFVFHIGKGGTFFDGYIEMETPALVFDEVTELYLLNLGRDVEFEFGEIGTIAVDRQKATIIARQFHNTQDKSVLGME
jgi:hypothetical protein